MYEDLRAAMPKEIPVLLREVLIANVILGNIRESTALGVAHKLVREHVASLENCYGDGI